MSVGDQLHPWLSVVGIGENGLEELTSVGRSLLSRASVIVGGETSSCHATPSR